MTTPETTGSKRPFRSLRTTLTLAFLFLSIAVLIISTALEGYFGSITQRDTIEEHQQLIAKNAAEAVRGFVEERFNALDAAVRFSDLAAANPEARRLALEKLLGSDTSIRWLTFFDTNGEQLSKISRLSGFAQEEPIGERTKTGFLDSVAGRGERYISQVIIDRITNEPLVVMATPVKNVFGDVKGILAAEVNLKFMWDLVGKLAIGKNGLAYVVDRGGNLIAFGDVGLVLKRDNLARLREVNEFINNSFEANSHVSKGILDTYVITTRETLGMPDWAVMVELPVTEAYEGIIRMLLLLFLILIFSFVLAIVVGSLLSERITKPIIRLRDAAQEIRRGKLETRIQVGSNNEIGQLAESFNDMTGRLAELIRELREEQARLLASINNLPLGFVLADVRGRIVLRNAAVDAVLGLGNAEVTLDVIAKTFEGTFDFKTRAAECMRERKIIELKEVSYGKKILRVVFIPIVMIRDHEEIIGYVLLIEDITEEKALERTRDEFFLIASHELRTPLTAIRGNIEMIQDFYGSKIQEKEVLDMISDVHDASIRLIALVNDFLDVSHIEQHRIELKKETIDLATTAKEVMHELGGLALKKGITLTLNVAPDVPRALGDKDRTKQILFNLVGNGINYTPKGSVTITIGKEKNRTVKVSVIDTGVGIREAGRQFLFKKFQQAGENIMTRGVTKGTGLGLYISKLLIEDMGGTIQLEKSEEGKGSTFSFTLPYVEGHNTGGRVLPEKV